VARSRQFWAKNASGERRCAEYVRLRIYPMRCVADFSPTSPQVVLTATSEMKGTNMTLQRRDAIKSLISIGLTVATSAGAQGKTIEISMTDSAFVPPTITIKGGDEVTWKNPALLLHTVTFDPAQAAESNVIDFASILAMAAREGARALKKR